MKKFLSLVSAAAVGLSAVSFTSAGAEAPAAPSGIEVPPSAVTYSSIAVIWDKPEDYADITGYNVYIDGEFAAATGADETYYTAEDLSADTEYTFSVRSLIGTVESDVAASVTASTAVKGTVYDVTQYGAKGDGTTLDTDAIQKAIDACEENDIVLLPEGYTFLSGALDLKSNMTFEVNGTLLSSSDPTDFEKDYDENGTYSGGETVAAVYTAEAQKRLIWSRIEGWEQYCYRSLINVGYLVEGTNYDTDGDNAVDSYVCSNVKICGTGTITGDSSISGYTPINGNATALARAEGASADEFYDIENSDTTENNIRSRIRGRLINVSNSQNVYIKDVTVANPPCWTVHMIYSDSISTNGVTFNTSGCRNGDGWDPDSSSNCTIFNCAFNTGDDCVAIKSGKNPEGNEIGIPAKNIKVIGCKSSGGLGLAVGSEMSGGVDGVEVRDCTLANTRYGVEIKANAVRGGYVKNFSVSDSTIDQILIHSVTYNADGDPADTPPVFSDMSFKNLTVTGYYNYTSSWLDTAIELVGFTDSDGGTDNYYVQNISFDNITVGTAGQNETQTISLTRCNGITFNDVVQVDGNSPTYSASNAEYIATINGVDVEDIVPTFTDSIEAEKMNLSGYAAESNSAASGGYCVSANSSDEGTASAEYAGTGGECTLTVHYFDENDGSAKWVVYVNDVQVDSWTANEDLGSASADSDTLTSRDIEVTLAAGDIIKIQGTKETYDPARLDKIVVTAPEPVIPDGVTAVYSGGTAVISSDTAYDSAAVIFAAYDSGGRLTDVCAAKAEIGIGSTEVPADDEFISSASDADDVRVFLWDSLDKMMPL